MDTTTLIRVIAGVLAVLVLAFLIYRRKHAKVSDCRDRLQYSGG